MPPQAPVFSVIVTTHLRAGLLERALQSLHAQSFQGFEIVVVADALDADTAAVCARLLRAQDVFVKRNGPSGPARSRNLALQLARGEWVTFLDDDDSYGPGHLQTALDRIHQPAADGQPQPRVLFSDFDLLTEDRTQQPIAPQGRARVALGTQPVPSLYVKNYIPNNALVFHRLALEACEVDPHLKSLEDWDFLLAVCTRHLPVHYVGGQAVVHKDYVNPGTRRGNSEAASDHTVVLDFLHVYKRWPAPTPELKAQRQELLKTAGLALPVEWF
jgi:glycosyltransferase involved in cell wall biosynthesis